VQAEEIALQLVAGTVLEGAFFAEPVCVLAAKARGDRIEIVAEGVNSKKTWKKLLKATEFEASITVKSAGGKATLTGDARQFRLAAEAHRIRLAYQYDPHFAVSVSQIDPLPHQLDAVYTRLLSQPRIRYLIADDPGAGKTIMAGLLLKELKFRRLAEKILIITPANLTDQWRRELKDKFAETFDVINRAAINNAFGRNLWEETTQAICSIDFLARSDDVQARMRDTRWDLVIVDEAHKMAAYRYGRKIETTARYDFGQFIAERTDHLLFLTATPHKGDPDNFALLLQLLDPDLYVTGEILSEAATQDENRIMCRRLKEDMRKFNGEPCFPPRYVRTTRYMLKGRANGPPFEASELGLYTAVTDYVQHHFQRAEDTGNRNVGLALTVLQRRVASSLAAIRLSLERRLKRLNDLRKLGQLRRQLDDSDMPTEFEDLEDLDERERWRLEDEAVERLTLAENMAELDAEIAHLEELVKLARQTQKVGMETKFEELREVLQQHIAGTSEKLLVFTEHKDTLDFLVGKLGDLGFRVTQIHGGMQLPQRINAEREFFESAQVMVATEAAGEGINLQFCSLMVNYDIPWNPNRLEQRMGRIHRYKQQNEVMIYNLVASNTREGQVLGAVLHKLDEMRKALGSDRVYDVIGEIVPAPKLDQLMRDWLARRRTMTEILADPALELKPADVDAIRADMQAKALGSRYIDMTKLEEDRQRSREHRLMPEYIERFFIEAYRSLGGTIAPAKGHDKGVWTIAHVPVALSHLSEQFERRFGMVGKTYPKLTFDKDRIVGYSDIEFVGSGHPLFEMVVERVLDRYGEALRSGAVFLDPDAQEPSVLWLLQGAVEDGHGTTVGQRLFAVRRNGDKCARSQPYALLDLKAPDGPSPTAPDDVLHAATDEDTVINWSLDNVLEPYFKEIQERRLHELGIKEKYVRKSLQQLITESNRKLSKYDAQLREFLDPNDSRALNIKGNRGKEAERRDQLIHRRDLRLAEIEHERHLSDKPPEILGVAAILPLQVDDPKLVGMRRDEEVERIAVQVAMEHERTQGRKPVSVEEENCGWDISSLAGGQVVRYIEVKGRAGDGDIAITENEWIKAQRFGKDYWLYIVTDCKAAPKLHMVQDPAGKLKPAEEVKIVRYRIDLDSWSRAATST
jgi:superfamily II DNA or RNA helicase